MKKIKVLVTTVQRECLHSDQDSLLFPVILACREGFHSPEDFLGNLSTAARKAAQTHLCVEGGVSPVSR